jgi:hypothetical protein
MLDRTTANKQLYQQSLSFCCTVHKINCHGENASAPKRRYVSGPIEKKFISQQDVDTVQVAPARSRADLSPGVSGRKTPFRHASLSNKKKRRMIQYLHLLIVKRTQGGVYCQSEEAKPRPLRCDQKILLFFDPDMQ